MGRQFRSAFAAARLLLLIALAALYSDDDDSWPDSIAHSRDAAPSIVFTPGEAAEKPNIIFILVDDLGYGDLGYMGSRYYETPHIDRLAAQGLRFSSAYSAGPNCQPTRAALMSGQYGPRTGIYTVGAVDYAHFKNRPLRPVENSPVMPLGKTLLPQAMKDAGYATGMFGKWQLGETDDYHPARRGFDEAIVAAGKHFNFETHPRVRVPKNQYLADFLTDKAVDFIRRHKEEPFFLYLPHYAVHTPHQAKPELIARFEHKAPVGGQDSPVYAAMIASIDESVGRIVAQLDELKLSERTLIIFSSDNGGGEVTSNAPLRGGKNSLYEGGIRVPTVFRWPGRITPGDCETPVTSVDFFPTFLELAGLTAPAEADLDGVSMVPLFDGRPLDRDALYWHFPEYFGTEDKKGRTTPSGVIRAGSWKLMEFFETGRVELYNLVDDLSERHNLAGQNPERARELLGKLQAWRKEIRAPMPTPNTK